MQEEKDPYKKVSEVPEDRYYGKHTQRSLELFSNGKIRVPLEIVYAYSFIKEAASIINAHEKTLSKEKRDWIAKAAKDIREKNLDSHFPLSVFQTGSGTHTNMNVNEVISGWVEKRSDGECLLHPNDDVNLSQSTNDTFPSAIQMAARIVSERELIPSLENLIEVFKKKKQEFSHVIKVARTHYMDAVPMRLSDEFSAYIALLEDALEEVKYVLGEKLSKLPLGGTAAGTGVKAPKGFGKKITKEISKLTGQKYSQSNNLFAGISMNMPCIKLSQALKNLSFVLIKITNDFTFLSSGPKAGIGELKLPPNESGSSIMPGKVNPTQCEAMRLAAIEVIANDQAVSMGEMHNHLQLSLSRPLLGYKLMESIEIISTVMGNFTSHCLEHLQLDEEMINNHLEHSFVNATIISEKIGYDKATNAVHKAREEKMSLKEAVIALRYLSQEEFEQQIKDSLKK